MIVLYDGECGFCRWTIAWALARDEGHLLVVAPIQSGAGARLLADIPPAERLRSVHVVYDDERRESGGSAAREVLKLLPSARPLAWLADRAPRWADRVYGFVAEHRRRFSQLVPDRAKRRADAVLAERTRLAQPPAQVRES
jgi:predicted DCC family thiol-disulfide oxidoreductase YuxK